MCKNGKNLIFCTCLEKEESSIKTNFLEGYNWNLTRYLGRNSSSLIGKMVIPKKDLGNGVTIEKVINQLNGTIKTFDFDYTPQERDCLDISMPHATERIRFFRVIFIDGKWIEGGNNIFRSITKKIAEGKIKFTDV